MVDRYLLPIPKTKNLRMYMRFKNKPLWALPYLFAVSMIAFQFNRYLALRAVIKLYFYILGWKQTWWLLC
jgi:hypothetical protein